MKPNQIAHLVREGLRNTWQNRLMALASVAVLVCCLLLTGFSYLLYANVEKMFQNAYDQNLVAVYLETDLTESAIERVGVKLRSLSNMNSVRFFSKEEFLAQYGDALADDVLDSFAGENNPLPDTYIVTMKDPALFRETIREIEAIGGVEEVSYDADTTEVLARVRRVVLAIGGCIIGVLLVVSLFIIVNTIKLTGHNRRLEIYLMKSVGATDGYVRFPFVVEGLLLGVIAGIIAFGLVTVLYLLVLNSLNFDNHPLLQPVPYASQWLRMLIGFLVGGMAVGVGGSLISMGKYLRQEGSLRE